ncbi:MAG TPA: DUF1801 domain-containing protein [Terracidiphilus sp.]|nr:DUF1801 domain-containing protein [Terracidiphilus sp.]
MSKLNPKVDAVLGQTLQWREETETLRAIALSFPLTEELKWYQPCYTLQGKNVVLIQGFKHYCALMFFKGALLKDPHHILARPGQHQSVRQLRFASLREILKSKPILKAYIQEAIEVEKTGLKVRLKKTSDYKLPEELQTRLDESTALRNAFRLLTPGRRHAYVFFIAQPRQSKTRMARVEKCIPKILAGKGPNE